MPLAAIALPPIGTDPEAELDYRARTGRIIAGVDVRAVDESGAEVPRDGVSVGELEARGPWVTGSYYREPAPERFDDGWLRTGDVGTIDGQGFIQLTDRMKDVIKSGGEWISSIEIENLAVGHPSVAEAAVIGLPHPKWGERPLLIVVKKPGAAVTREEMLEYLKGKIASWWMPDDVVFSDTIPHTATGKIQKRDLRETWKSHKLPT